MNPLALYSCYCWFPGIRRLLKTTDSLDLFKPLLKQMCFLWKSSKKMVLWTFNDGDFFFRGAQVLCRQQLAFHLCHAVPAKSGAWTLPSAHAWTRRALDLTKSRGPSCESGKTGSRVSPTHEIERTVTFFFSIIFRDSVAYLLRPRLRAPTLGSKWTACCLTGLVGDYRAHPSQSGKAMVESCLFLHLMESAPNLPGSNRKAYS